MIPLFPPELSVFGKAFCDDVELESLYTLPGATLYKLNADLVTTLFAPDDAKSTINAVKACNIQSIVGTSKPKAYAYAGHQYGKFNPLLGDGRCVSLGRIKSKKDEVEISLKGAGVTSFSFRGDGKASITECEHEFEISQKLVECGIPCCQSLAVISYSEQVYRQGFKPRAILIRSLDSFIRFGTFELCFFKKDTQALRALSDLVIHNHYSHLNELNEKQRYVEFFREVVTRTAVLIAQWQKAGFVHGMMNTDNMSITGKTLDFGESYFLNTDEIEAQESSPREDRYAFTNQAVIGLWNCNVLARALSPLIDAKHLKSALSNYETCFVEAM